MNDRAIEALREVLGSDGFSDHPADRESMAYDASGQVEIPRAVAFPQTEAQVAEVVRLANEFRFPIIPRGAGSGLTGGSQVLDRDGLVLTLHKMNRIIDLDPGDMVAVVEPGVITSDLQAAAEAVGLYYPPDPASRAFSTIGGNLAENAGGMRAVKYGVTRDSVLGLNAVLGDGRFIKAGTRTIKSVVGYDLTRLMIGCEGTLGIITQATLKLIPKPQAKATLIGVFGDLTIAAQAVNGVFRAGVMPVALEFMDRTTLTAVAESLPFDLTARHGALILAEMDGSEAAVRAEAEIAAKVFADLGGEVKQAADDDEAEALWAARRSVSPAVKRIKPKKLAEDVAVPRSQLPVFVSGMYELSEKLGVTVAAYGHAGDGNVHVNLLYDGPEEYERAKAMVGEVFKLALSLNGTLSGEHGIGTAKADYLGWELGPDELGFMRDLKKLCDPNNILNPGKIFSGAEGGGAA